MSDHDTRDFKTDVQVSLGDIVTVSEGTPYSHDWRGLELKIVSLRIDPEGKLWASVIDTNDPRNTQHRQFGIYDGEATDFDARHLTRAAPVQRSDAAEDACCKGLAPESECACMRPDWKERLAARPQCDADNEPVAREALEQINKLLEAKLMTDEEILADIKVVVWETLAALAPHNQGAGK